MFRFLIECKYNGFYCSRSGWLKNIFIRLNRFSLLNNVCWKTIERFGMFYSQTSDTGSFIRRTIEIVVWNNVESFKFYLFMIFLFFVCFIGIIILAYSWNKLSSFLFLIYFKFGKAGSGETGLLFLYSIKFKHLLWEFAWILYGSVRSFLRGCSVVFTRIIAAIWQVKT